MLGLTLQLLLNVVGNKRFRGIIDQFAPNYVSASTKLDKTQVIAAVIEKIRSDSPGGGFVKKDFYSGRWYEIGNEKARDKVGHAIRKAAEELQKTKKGEKEDTATGKELSSRHKGKRKQASQSVSSKTKKSKRRSRVGSPGRKQETPSHTPKAPAASVQVVAPPINPFFATNSARSSAENGFPNQPQHELLMADHQMMPRRTLYSDSSTSFHGTDRALVLSSLIRGETTNNFQDLSAGISSSIFAGFPYDPLGGGGLGRTDELARSVLLGDPRLLRFAPRQQPNEATALAALFSSSARTSGVRVSPTIQSLLSHAATTNSLTNQHLTMNLLNLENQILHRQNQRQVASISTAASSFLSDLGRFRRPGGEASSNSGGSMPQGGHIPTAPTPVERGQSDHSANRNVTSLISSSSGSTKNTTGFDSTKSSSVQKKGKG